MYIKKTLKKLMAASMITSSLILTPVINSDLHFTSIVHAEIKTYTGVGEYVMSNFETPDLAQQRAKAYAEQNAQEQAGVYLNSYSKMQNLEIVEDEVVTITNGILNVIDVKYEVVPVTETASIMYRATVKANIDTSKVDEWIKKGVNERSSLVAQNKELQNSIAEQEKQIAALKKQLAEKNSNIDTEKLKAELTNIDNAFLSNQKIEEGNRFYFNGNYDNAIYSYNQAIELNSHNIIAYRNRGTTYANLKKYTLAADDYTRLIELEPNNSAAYVGRGAAYIYLKKYELAIKDLTRAVELNPNDSMAYYNRGICYQAIHNNEKAQADFSKSKSLE